MTFVRTVAWLPWVLALGEACFPAETVPPNAQIECASTSECPADLVCDTDARLCVPDGATLDRAPPFLVDSSVDEPVVGAAQTALVSFTTSEPLGKTPVVTYTRGDVDVAVVVDGAGDSFVAHVAPGDDDVSGPVTLTTTIVDEAANATTARIPVALAFDLEAPAPVAVTTTIAADPAANPLFPGAPAAIREDSGLTVDVIFAEPVAAVTVALVDAAGAAVGAPVGATVEAERASATFGAGTFAATVDGALGVNVVATDAHGNTFTGDVASLLAAPLVVDNAPPDPPAFDTFARAPWGTVHGTDAATGAGSASDALLVLLLPEGVGVVDGAVPPTVARLVPDAATGAFTFALPIDVPGLTAVAVDAAGNMSAPAPASETAVTASVIDPTSPHDVVARPAALAALVQGADRPAAGALRAGVATVTATPFWRPLTTAVDDNDTVGASLAFDPVVNAVIAVSFDGSTSIVDGAQVKDAGQPALPVRGGQAMAFDERRGVVVLFGGHGLDGQPTNQLFEWDGAHWSERLENDPSDATRPAPRVAHSMAFVPALGGVVVVDGCGVEVVEGLPGCSPSYVDLWLWDGDTFTALCNGADACGDGPLNLHPAVGVDRDGRLIGAGGVTEPPSIRIGGSPVVFAFDEAAQHWVPECDGACAADLPVDAAIVPFSGGAAFVGGCPPASGLSGTCVSTYDAQSGFTPVAVDDRGPARATPAPFQAQPVVGLPDGTILEVGTDRTVRIKDGARDQVRPSSLTPRCSAATTSVAENDVVVSGGCGRCDANPGGVTMTCLASLPTTEHIVDDVVRAAPDGPAGASFTALVDDGVGGRVAVVVSTVDGVNAGETGVASAVLDAATGAFVPADSVFDAGVPDLRAVGLVTDPDDTSRALVFFASGDSSLDRVGAVDATGALSTLCAGACDAAVTLGFAGAGGDGGAALFGGWIAFNDVSGTTSAIASDHVAPVGVSGTSPPARSLAAMAFDDERKVAWLFGGTADFTLRNSLDNPLCGAGPTADCGDVWGFDGATSTWAPVSPVPVLPFGDPGTRVASSSTARDGALVVTGGGRGGADVSPDGQAWRLDVSPALAPAHVFTADLAAEGTDAAGTPTSLEVTWCGAAADAGGAAVPVDVELWTPTGFVALAHSAVAINGAPCIDAATNDGAPLAFVARGPDRVVTARVKPHPGTATGLGFSTLSTTAFEVTAHFAR